MILSFRVPLEGLLRGQTMYEKQVPPERRVRSGDRHRHSDFVKAAGMQESGER
jgi:hypothetical protein